MTAPTLNTAKANSSIDYVECPHCHNEVMERADGQCLACGKSHFDVRGADLHRTMVTIENVHRLPSCCFICGEDTSLKQRFSWTYRADTGHLPPCFAVLVAIFSYLPGSQYRIHARINLPVCACCASLARKARPLSLRAGLDCRLLVHRNFRCQFEKLNGREYMEWERDIQLGKAPPAATGARPKFKLL